MENLLSVICVTLKPRKPIFGPTISKQFSDVLFVEKNFIYICTRNQGLEEYGDHIRVEHPEVNTWMMRSDDKIPIPDSDSL